MSKTDNKSNKKLPMIQLRPLIDKRSLKRLSFTKVIPHCLPVE